MCGVVRIVGVWGCYGSGVVMVVGVWCYKGSGGVGLLW